MADKKYLIGLHGKPRVGKDTTAAYLIKKLNLLRYGPSVRLKDTVATMFDVPREYLDDDNMKDKHDQFWDLSYRQMCQLVGKESSRDVFGDDFWLRHVEKKLKEMTMQTQKGLLTYSGLYNGIVLADIRYANEIEWVKKQGGDVFFIVRDDAPKTSDKGHVVDQGLPLELADVVLYNNGTIEELYASIEKQLSFYYTWQD